MAPDPVFGRLRLHLHPSSKQVFHREARGLLPGDRNIEKERNNSYMHKSSVFIVTLYGISFIRLQKVKKNDYVNNLKTGMQYTVYFTNSSLHTFDDII